MSIIIERRVCVRCVEETSDESGYCPSCQGVLSPEWASPARYAVWGRVRLEDLEDALRGVLSLRGQWEAAALAQ